MDTATASDEKKNIFEAAFQDLKVKDLLVKLFLVFLPFSQALTINIGFPLKFSEIFLFLLLAHEAITGNIFRWRFNKPVLLSLAFVFVVLISVIINILYSYNYNLSVEYARLTPALDSILKFFYVVIALLALIITRNALRDNPEFIKWFFVGATISSLYAWYLCCSGILRLPTVILPGMEASPQIMNVGPFDVIRCATFKEGNYMGFFLLIAGIVASYHKKKWLTIFYFLTIITTFSTTSIFCATIFLVLLLFKKYKRFKLKLIGAMGVMLFVLITLIQVSPEFKGIFYDKVFGSEDTVENTNDLYSKADRLNTALVGLSIFANNPVFGIGLANYGLHFNHYNTLPELDQIDQNKRIPNNIYVEILSECGLVAFVIFIAFLYSLFNAGKHKSNGILTSGLIACLVYFFAFPTFTMLFIWVFFGIILA